MSMTTAEATSLIRLASGTMDFNQVMIIVANADLRITVEPFGDTAWTCTLIGRDGPVLRKGATPLEAARRALRGYYLTEAVGA